MHKISLDNIRLQDFELFLAVAKYGSFTKAGEKTFVTQSWVSKRMNLLESELGLQLFLRNSSRMTLTPAGKYLKERLETAQTYLMNTLYEANRIQTGIAGSLRVGTLEWANNVAFSPLQAFIKKNPHISVEVFCQQFSDFRNQLNTDNLDMIFTMEYDNNSFLETSIESLQLCPAQIMVYVSVDNPLSKKEFLEIEDLRSQEMLMLYDTSSAGYNDFVLDLFRSKNIRPLISQYASSGREHIANILFDHGALIASRFFLDNEYKDFIRAVPLKGIQTYVTAVWKKNNSNPVLPMLLLDLENAFK